MLKRFLRLLGEDAAIFRRYAAMALGYGVLSGLTIAALAPTLSRLLSGDTVGALPWLGLLLGGAIASWLSRRHVEKAGIDVGIAVLRGGRQRIGDHVARLPIGWFTPDNSARLGHIVSQGMMEVAQIPAHVFTPILSGGVVPLVIVVALFLLHWQMGLIALLALPILVLVFLTAARLGLKADASFQRDSATASQRMVEFAQAQSVLRAFSGEGDSSCYLDQAITRQQGAGRRMIFLSATSVVLNAWVMQAIFAALLVAAALWLNADLGGSLDRASVIAVIVALILAHRFVDPLLEVAGYGEALRAARGQLAAIDDILMARPLPEPTEPRRPANASVNFSDVCFRYAPDEPLVLHDINLHIAPGSMTAFVGPSGSGKTTLVRLIARFFDVEQGSIAIGGVDVRQIANEDLANSISQIFQDSYLFQGSIADNIRLGRPGASDADVMNAARQASVTEMIERLPQGLETPVGEGGTRLSGGERQRVAIARALLRDAPILLVDEATAALDAENQAIIADTLARLRGKRTIIVIAHQLSTVAMADRIVVLDDGRIIEQGSHAELQGGKGLYARFLAQRQVAKGWRIAAPRSPVNAA